MVYLGGNMGALSMEVWTRINNLQGGITQLVECVLCKHEVISSILVTSNLNFKPGWCNWLTRRI